jgi:flagellar M-ring protein FliF
MPDWASYLRIARAQAVRVPPIAWAVAGVIAVALAAVVAMETSAPPYAALYEGLTPAQGGDVIAQLQKLGIPYQLQAAGNIILVPAPELASARLQLGVAQVPGDDVSDKWSKLEDAPMTTSDAAQAAMANQALEASLAQSIETMSGIQSAQVYLALPPDTPFLDDQPKPAASVVVTADAQSAATQGEAIARLVSGAVPGLSAQQVTVETTSGVAVYPVGSSGTAAMQLHTQALVENAAAARVAELLTPLVGAGNFRVDVSANVDFTQEQIHQISYGPAQSIAHQVSDQTDKVGGDSSASGIPGALSNQPPASTTAATPPTPVAGSPPADAAAASQAAAASAPHETTKNLDQTYVTNQSDSQITKPDWVVTGIAVSVVLNKAALQAVSTDQVKTAVAGAFAYPQVNVNVLAAPFQAGVAPSGPNLLAAVAPVSRAVLELMAAAALLFGVALPFGRQLNAMTTRLPAPARANAPAVATVARPLQPATPRRDISQLRLAASDNPAAVARLLESWVGEA